MSYVYENPWTQIRENVLAYLRQEPNLRQLGVLSTSIRGIVEPQDVWSLKPPAIGVCHLPSRWPEPPEIGNLASQPCAGRFALVIVADSARTGIEAADQAKEIQHFALTVREQEDLGPLGKTVGLYAIEEKVLANPDRGEGSAGPSAQVVILETTVFSE